MTASCLKTIMPSKRRSPVYKAVSPADCFGQYALHEARLRCPRNKAKVGAAYYVNAYGQPVCKKPYCRKVTSHQKSFGEKNKQIAKEYHRLYPQGASRATYLNFLKSKWEQAERKRSSSRSPSRRRRSASRASPRRRSLSRASPRRRSASRSSPRRRRSASRSSPRAQTYKSLKAFFDAKMKKGK